MTIEEDFALLRSLSVTARRAADRIEAELNYRFRAQDELRNGMFRFDELTKERDALKAAMEDCKHFLLQMKQESLGPLFGMANYKHEADRLYEEARQALAKLEDK